MIALARIRAIPRGRVPTFLVGEPIDEARMSRLADGFIARPLSPSDLIARVRARLKPSNHDLLRDASEPTAAPSSPARAIEISDVRTSDRRTRDDDHLDVTCPQCDRLYKFRTSFLRRGIEIHCTNCALSFVARSKNRQVTLETIGGEPLAPIGGGDEAAASPARRSAPELRRSTPPLPLPTSPRPPAASLPLASRGVASDAQSPPRRIFICYRRKDSAYATGHFSEVLRARLGSKRVFQDIESIPLGTSFPEFIEKTMKDCSILFAIVGRNWLPGIELETDHVRIEIEAAFRLGLRVIPVLVDQASLPQVAELPPSLRGLPTLNSTFLRPLPDLHTDVTKIIRVLEEYWNVSAHELRRS